MPGFTVQLEGFDAVIKQLDVKGFEQEITLELDTFGKNVVEDAKAMAPVNEGFLVNSIGSKSSSLQVEVFANADYAAYVEFGTRKYAARYVATLPPDWKTFAAKYKGKGSGGSFDDFVQSIMRWVQKKGIGALKTKSGKASTSASSLDAQQQAAYWIALNIIQNGIKPHPFLFPSIEKNTPKLIERLKALFK